MSNLRIVSLLPSATEILCTLGAREQLVGVSHECDYPPGVECLPAVTRTLIPKNLSSAEIDQTVREQLNHTDALYSLDLSVLKELRPDLIVTQALCDVCAVSAAEVDSAACQLPGNPEVVNLEPMSLQDVLDTMLHLALRTGLQKSGDRAVDSLRKRIDAVKSRSASIDRQHRPTVGFLEWIDPLFNAGHWTPELIAYAGGTDCLGNPHQPSQSITPDKLWEADPDLLFVALCGFDLERTRRDLGILAEMDAWQELSCVRNGRLFYTDGNSYFSRPGPRLVDSLEILAHCLHPDLHPLTPDLQAINFTGLLN